MRTSGINAANQMTRPMKSFVSRCELSEKVFFMCAKPGCISR